MLIPPPQEQKKKDWHAEESPPRNRLKSLILKRIGGGPRVEHNQNGAWEDPGGRQAAELRFCGKCTLRRWPCVLVNSCLAAQNRTNPAPKPQFRRIQTNAIIPRRNPNGSHPKIKNEAKYRNGRSFGIIWRRNPNGSHPKIKSEAKYRNGGLFWHYLAEKP